MSKIHLTITTPIKTVYSNEVDQLTLTTTSGEITVLPRHIPLISTLKTGHVIIKKDGEETLFAIDGGLLEVRKDSSVIVLSDRSEYAREIDIERAEKAVEKAKKYLENPEGLELDYQQLKALLAKEQNRTKLAKKGHRK